MKFGSMVALLTGSLVIAPLAASADDAPSRPVTFNEDILPLLQENCQDCHRPEGANMSGIIAPMSLTSYQEVRPWAKSILKSVESREMPPWLATSETHGKFSNERVLDDEEIALFRQWVQSGSQLGSPEVAPAPKEFASYNGWSIGKPDLVVTFDEPFMVEDDVWDLYQNITIELTEEMLPEDRYIKALEFKPGGPVVHHIIAYAHAPGQRGGTTRGMLAGMAPGTNPPVMPDDYGILLRKGSKVTFQMHYHKDPGPGTAVEDMSSMALIFHEGDVAHPVDTSAISNGRFEIPPNAHEWKVGMARTFDEDTMLLSMMPHSHLRGCSARYTAYYPDGTTELLLSVPNYDFNWQVDYLLKDPKLIPAGTRIEAEMWYCNTPAQQALAPEVDPGKATRFGGPTTDEMDLAWIKTAPANPVVASK